MLSLELFNRDYWKQDALTVARTGREKIQALVQRAVGGMRSVELCHKVGPSLRRAPPISGRTLGIVGLMPRLRSQPVQLLVRHPDRVSPQF